MKTVSAQTVTEFIHRSWIDTICTPAQQGAGELPLPKPFVVPTAGPQFQMFYYWDTFFASVGLIHSGMLAAAKDNADNMLHLMDTLGYVPNYPLKRDLNRSQPPVAAALVRLVYEHTHDREWLAQALPSLEKEYVFWQTYRRGPHGLNHYGHHATSAALEENATWVPERLVGLPTEPMARQRFLTHVLAEAESGWDFTPRFAQRCADCYAIDLNALLYQHERNAAWFRRELGLPGAELWEQRAVERQALVDALLWDPATGFYYDYNFCDHRSVGIVSAAAFFALWSGLASPDQATRLAANLPWLEHEFGLATCQAGCPAPLGQIYQWDYPNLWPPLTYAAMVGLERYGCHADAARLAEKYVATVTQSYAATGNLWEKYNCHSGGVDVAAEYAMPPMLGWTAGTFLAATAWGQQKKVAASENSTCNSKG